MSRASALANAPIALGAIREDGKAELQRVLEAHEGDKCLVLDPSLGSPLNHILVEGSQVLKDFGMRELKQANHQPIETSCDVVVFLVRPVLSLMKIVARQIQHVLSA